MPTRNTEKTIRGGIRTVPLEGTTSSILALRRPPSHEEAIRKAVEPLTSLLAPLLEKAKNEPEINASALKPLDLVNAFLKGNASILVDSSNTEEAIGFVRIKPRLTPEKKEQLRIIGNYQIWEMGTLILTSDYRHSGIGTRLVMDLATSHGIKVKGEDLLIIATMKGAATMATFGNAFKNLGRTPYFYSHLDLPMIGAFTCTCSGSFGSGMHIEPAPICFERMEEKDILAKVNSWYTGRIDTKGVAKCVLFVSDRDLADRINQSMAEAMGRNGRAREAAKREEGLTPESKALITELKRIGHYS